MGAADPIRTVWPLPALTVTEVAIGDAGVMGEVGVASFEPPPEQDAIENRAATSRQRAEDFRRVIMAQEPRRPFLVIVPARRSGRTHRLTYS